MLSGFCPACLLNTVLETEVGSEPSGSRIDDYELLMIATLLVIPLLMVFGRPSSGDAPNHTAVIE